MIHSLCDSHLKRFRMDHIASEVCKKIHLVHRVFTNTVGNGGTDYDT